MWSTKDTRTYECDVCKRTVSTGFMHSGHIVDRFMGGSDDPDNLVPMCAYCNQHKPGHATKEEYEAWRDAGYWKHEYAQEIAETLSAQGFTVTYDIALGLCDTIEGVVHEFEVPLLEGKFERLIWREIFERAQTWLPKALEGARGPLRMEAATE